MRAMRGGVRCGERLHDKPLGGEGHAERALRRHQLNVVVGGRGAGEHGFQGAGPLDLERPEHSEHLQEVLQHEGRMQSHGTQQSPTLSHTHLLSSGL